VSPQVRVNFPAIRDRLYSFLPRLIPTERQRVLALTVLSGGVCGLAAVAFHVGIGKAERLLIDRAISAPHFHWIYLTILTPALGGFVVGLALQYWSPAPRAAAFPR